jgi:phospholipid/cholesterol/gamma-HCH transport system permease protein
MTDSVLGFGNIDGTIKLLLSVVIRELAPLLTALIVIARSGTAVASELGNMKVNREVDALISMGIHPLNFIIFPRIVGGVVSVVILGSYFAFAAAVGGILSSSLIGKIALSYFVGNLLSAITAADFLLLLFKLIASGALVFVIASFHGLSAQKSPTEVPIVTTQAVMKSIVSVMGINILISLTYYLYQFNKVEFF